MTLVEQSDIIKPNSWEYIVAQEAKLSPEEFSSSQPTIYTAANSSCFY